MSQSCTRGNRGFNISNDLASEKFSALLGLQPKSLTPIPESFLSLLAASAGARHQVHLPSCQQHFRLPQYPSTPDPRAPAASSRHLSCFTKTTLPSTAQQAPSPVPLPTSASLLPSQEGDASFFPSLHLPLFTSGFFPPKYP